MCYGYRDAATMESKMRRFWILLMALPLLAACVSLADLRAEREAQLGSFIGQAEADRHGCQRRLHFASVAEHQFNRL